ncbi:MAG: DUF1465 family protein [Nitratireductor sp.]
MDNSEFNNEENMVTLAEKFAFSEKFSELFAEGMQLVEESASYLDDKGRKAAKTLVKEQISLYATESMRLTTRLMQLASWLLLQRATKEGEMSRDQFLDEKKKIKLDQLPVSKVNDDWANLPEEFISLVSRSLALQNRIITIDSEIYSAKPQNPPSESPVEKQLNLLSTALGVARKH